MRPDCGSPSVMALSTYDAIIAAAALLADCETLSSEDMRDGLVIDGRLRIFNPFRRSELAT